MSASKTHEQPEDVVIQLALEPLLSRLETEELQKPPTQRREVPNIPALAAIAGVHRVTMYNLVKGHVKQVNLELLTAVFNELRRRGFNVQVSDLLTAYPANPAEAESEASNG